GLMTKIGEGRVRSGHTWLLCAALWSLQGCGGGGDESGSSISGGNQAFNTAEDTLISQTPLDVRGAGAISLTMVTAPVLGSAELTTGSRPSFIYLPDRDRNGTDSFTYQALDSRGGSITLAVTIHIAAVADPAFVIISGFAGLLEVL